jgi:hypothetical protein
LETSEQYANAPTTATALRALRDEHRGCEAARRTLTSQLDAVRTEHAACAGEHTRLCEETRKLESALHLRLREMTECHRYVAEADVRRGNQSAVLTETQTQLQALRSEHNQCVAAHEIITAQASADADTAAARTAEAAEKDADLLKSRDAYVALNERFDACNKQLDATAASLDAVVTEAGSVDEIQKLKSELADWRRKEATRKQRLLQSLQCLKTMRPRIGIVFEETRAPPMERVPGGGGAVRLRRSGGGGGGGGGRRVTQTQTQTQTQRDRESVDGIAVKAVPETLPAYASGVRVADVILQVAGTTTKTKDDFKRLLHRKRAGDHIPLLILRAGCLVTVVLVVGAAGYTFADIK